MLLEMSRASIPFRSHPTTDEADVGRVQGGLGAEWRVFPSCLASASRETREFSKGPEVGRGCNDGLGKYRDGRERVEEQVLPLDGRTLT